MRPVLVSEAEVGLSGLPRTLENLESQGKSGKKILALESRGIFRWALDFLFFQAFSLCRERAAAEGKTCLTTDAKVEALK